ncbi:hypothetical protein [Amaricoccus tamworthensis]|uniref:hypothetical protein n=1 Tax=Amaricoccus tamworthensis TaxID=57002 RepID=UPI003C7BE962
MTSPSASPAPLREDELRETLDLLATAVASISDGVDDQTRMLDQVNKTATEARQAAFAARKQTDPENYGAMIGETLNRRIGGSLDRVERLTGDLQTAARQTQEVLRDARGKGFRIDCQLWEREYAIGRFKGALPWLGLGAVVLVIGLTAILPRFMAGNLATCVLIGGSWSTASNGVEACMFYP